MPKCRAIKLDGKPCSFNAHKDLEELFCGHHRRQYLEYRDFQREMAQPLPIGSPDAKRDPRNPLTLPGKHNQSDPLYPKSAPQNPTLQEDRTSTPPQMRSARLVAKPNIHSDKVTTDDPMTLSNSELAITKHSARKVLEWLLELEPNHKPDPLVESDALSQSA